MYFTCSFRPPLCPAVSGLTKIAFSFPLLVSYLVLKATLVPIGGILFSNPVQELGITNMSLSSSFLMKPYFAPAMIAFMNPVLGGRVRAVSVPS